MPHGVGIVGAGPGVAALHLPTLARMSDDFDVVHISDAGSGRAAQLANRVGARSSSGIEALLADERVSVVVLCSPPAEHAGQILASVAAGKRAILCEKPIATTEADAEAAIDVCRAAGVALLIGTNHLYDPAWGRAKHHLLTGGHRVRAISVTLALPPNGRYHDVVTELPVPAAAPGRGGPDLTTPQVAASVVRQLITGLAVHDLPMLRDLAPVIERVVFARAVAPIGYVLGYRASGIPVRLATVMLPDGADALWNLEITTDSDIVTVSFPPAFVHVGSAEVRVETATGKRTTYPIDGVDGYLAEWRALADVLNGSSVVEYDEMLDDARYAISLADAAFKLIGGCGMIDVHAPVDRYRATLAELPLSTRSLDRPGGAIVVVPGEVGWVDAAVDAESAGAVAVIVARPEFAPAADIRRLQDETRIPVIVERALLRPDSARDAAAHRLTDAGRADPRLLAADGSAPREFVPLVVRDAAGWLRILAGGDLDVVAADGGLALLETRGGIAATLSVVATSRPGGSIRVRALGEVLTEIEVDVARTRVRTSTVRGSLSAPDRYESSARLAVRRAVAALRSSDLPGDLRELAVDTEVVERVQAGKP